MGEAANSVLLIENSEPFRTALADALIRKRYTVSAEASIDDACKRFGDASWPTFILVDRLLGDGLVDKGPLEVLCRAAAGSYVVVYTRIDELSECQEYALLAQGAFRVIDKKDADLLVEDVGILTSEFDELLRLAEQLRMALAQRAKLATALVGSGVGVTIIDHDYRCWFANPIQEKLVGCKPASGNLCWTLFHGHPSCCGPCWGCTVRGVIDSKNIVERVFLARFTDGSVKWVSVRSSPVQIDEGGAVLAVSEGVVELPELAVGSLDRDFRVRSIARGLIHSGFGRARVYRIRGKSARLIAAAARSDDPAAAESHYEQQVSGSSLPWEQCEHHQQAVQNGVGVFLAKGNANKKAVPAEIGETAPAFVIPILGPDRKLLGFIEADFEGYENKVRPDVLRAYAKQESLQWLARYTEEAAKALNALDGPPAERNRITAVEQAMLGVGSATSLAGAMKAIRDAFSSLVEGCRVSVREAVGEGAAARLVEYEPLCFGPRSDKSPFQIGLDDKISLASRAFRTRMPVMIPDQVKYRKDVVTTGEAVGYCDERVRSSIHIPLMFEGVPLGTLSVDSDKSIDWLKDGYVRPLRDLSNYVALVVRDILLDQESRRAHEREAAIIAFSASASEDALWRPWAVQRLAASSALLARCEKAIRDRDLAVVEATLAKLTGLIGSVTRGFSPDQAPAISALENVFHQLEERYRSTERIINFKGGKDLSVRVPDCYVRFILETLVDNALDAIARAGFGQKVDVVAGSDSGYVRIAVQDDGPGIDANVLPKLFAAKIGSDPGHGTGLLEARGAALQYGGDLVHEKQERGALFVATLPVATDTVVGES